MNGNLKELDDEQLCERLARLACAEKESLASVLECLIEFDLRRVHEKKSSPSLFDYCVRILGYSESAAGKRIFAARAAAKYSLILSLIREGRLHLESVVMLAAHLDAENHARVLLEACGKTKREVEWIVAGLAPQPDSQDSIRPLPIRQDPIPVTGSVPFSPPAAGSVPPMAVEQPLHLTQSIKPTAPDRARVSFTGSGELLALLKRAQDLLRHKYPAGELEHVFMEALNALLDRKDPHRRSQVREAASRPASSWAFASRHVSQAVRDAVYRRDRGRCVYRDGDGPRCPETGGLEFDHIIPFALGGASNDPENIRLLCRTHNLMLARDLFGAPVSDA